MNYYFVQAFKIIVTDPDSVLSALTREVKETGPDGQEVMPVCVRILGHILLFMLHMHRCDTSLHLNL